MENDNWFTFWEYSEFSFIAASLAAKVARQDSLARFLRNRPTRIELVEKNIIQEKSSTQKVEDRNAIGSKLIRWVKLHAGNKKTAYQGWGLHKCLI